MKKLITMYTAVSLLLLTFNGCSKEEKTVSPPLPGNEFLTTVQLVVTNTANAADVQTASWRQLPDQPVDSSQAKLILKSNSVYTVAVKFLDESTSPAGDITTDIYDRRNYHLICFAVTGANLAVARTDLDTNTPPLQIGLQDSFTTTAASSGSLNVQLRHQPNAKNGDCAPGSTDADANFSVNITN